MLCCDNCARKTLSLYPSVYIPSHFQNRQNIRKLTELFEKFRENHKEKIQGVNNFSDKASFLVIGNTGELFYLCFWWLINLSLLFYANKYEVKEQWEKGKQRINYLVEWDSSDLIFNYYSANKIKNELGIDL